MKEDLFILLGYLSGSVLYAYYLPLWFLKLDVTQGARDQNPGAFNCIRRAGWPMGLLALACDIAKGALPVLWARHAVDMSAWCFALVLSAGARLSPYPSECWPDCCRCGSPSPCWRCATSFSPVWCASAPTAAAPSSPMCALRHCRLCGPGDGWSPRAVCSSPPSSSPGTFFPRRRRRPLQPALG